jgi:hypothetical protein
MPESGFCQLLMLIGLLTVLYFVGSFLDFVTDYLDLKNILKDVNVLGYIYVGLMVAGGISFVIACIRQLVARHRATRTGT